ncbi:MAG TPA: hypothetical protein VG917_02940, partial [Patescibacteria group bacterium]|nr:hypothetical protein [Patescibacteria group bacterium]
KWGGRYNLILTKRGRTISDSQWTFLKQYDPDFVNLAIPSTKKLALDLDTKITPLHVISGISRENFSPSIDESGLSIYPSAQTIRQVGNAFGSDVFYVLFDVEECEDENIKKFIERNFGTTDLRDISNQRIRDYAHNLRLKITDKASFITALMSFNDFKPYVFPIQLSSLGDFIGDDRSHDNENNFYVFVGDSPMDLVDFWNNPFYLQSWTRTRLRQIWIPSVLAEDPELKEAFQKFIHGRADPYGNGQKTAIFCTRSLTNAKINEIAASLTEGTWLLKQAGTRRETPYPDYGNYFSFDRIKLEMIHFRGTGEEEKIIVPPPDIQEGVMGGEHWMNDLYIQVPEKKVVPVNFETWLQLPKNNSVAHTVINTGPSRINQDGIPSVLSARSSQFNSTSQDIIITIPKTWNVFASMILNTGKPYFTTDIRYRYIKPYQYTISVSGAGRHIHGFLEVFGSLESAYQIFEERHWRMFFDQISNVTPEKEQKRLDEIKAKLTKQIRRLSADPANLSSGRFLDWLADKMQDTARVYAEEKPKAVPFSELEKIAKSELAEYNSKNPNSRFRYLKRDVVGALKTLTDSQIVLIGYEMKCPNCLNREWRALNEIDQMVTCRGCGYSYPFPPENEIFYKLNSLVENGIRSRGVAPVILGLGTIFRDARHYFDFLPPVDIFKKGKHITDLDICCIIDGKFIIGEVKVKYSLLHPSDFETMTQLAKEIHPDKIVFCTMDRTIPQRIKDQITQMNTDLAPYDVIVEWLYFDRWIFEANPIR